MFHFLHSLYNKCLLERLRYFHEEKSERSNHSAYHRLSNWFLVLDFIFYVVRCKQYVKKNSDTFSRTLTINRVDL